MKMARAVIGAALVASAPAAAVTVPLTFSLNAQYYTVTTKPTPAGDFQTYCCNDVRTNMVLATLGPNGLPVLNPASTGPQVFKGVASTGELQWWTPGVTNGGDTVTASGTGTITLPFADTSFFAPNGGGSNNANGFLTARFSGSFTLAAPRFITFNLRADDDAFLFVNNTLFTGIGGVHSATSAPTVRQLFGAGTHTVNLFYADRHRTAAELRLSGVSEPIPEPASWAMLIAGFGLVGAALRRRTATAAA